jgi:transcriptional regulator with XRE-family HTH domain
MSEYPEPLFRTRGQTKVPVDGTKLRAFRKQLSISQYELAKRTGISRSYIADIEQGVKEPRQLAAQALAQGLNVTLGDLVKST